MDKFVVSGGATLDGEVPISGAKNAALPILAASLLSPEPLQLANLPDLRDVHTMLRLLRILGARVNGSAPGRTSVSLEDPESFSAPYELVRTMRASLLVLGPLLGRFGRADVSLPGGCAIGARPVDIHVDALRSMGAEVEIRGGYISARCRGLTGARIDLPLPTVTGTENILMAAVLAEGETVIENAAREPEVRDLADCLNAMGAKVSGAGGSRISVRGVKGLHGASRAILPDRIEAGTYLVAGAMTGGRVVARFNGELALGEVVGALRNTGATVRRGEGFVELDMQGRRPHSVNLVTAPWPGFPTDMQAQFTALNAIASEHALVRESVFEQRFMHVAELKRMGADIEPLGREVLIRGVRKLQAAPVMATDLRASASLVLAALVAEGETVIHRVYHVDRGYERIEEKLNDLGAVIRRV
ncbi:MAG: UDP-N-acetylglucosamine 1-carboxyvinyltransferase [Gammaproteobacteria bacterium]|nr:UDP-N-acetylglucosamine 1-carboxyvinyltransferase [Gammaproteobacteria bacterium]